MGFLSSFHSRTLGYYKMVIRIHIFRILLFQDIEIAQSSSVV